MDTTTNEPSWSSESRRCTKKKLWCPLLKIAHHYPVAPVFCTGLEEEALHASNSFNILPPARRARVQCGRKWTRYQLHHRTISPIWCAQVSWIRQQCAFGLRRGPAQSSLTQPDRLRDPLSFLFLNDADSCRSKKN